MIIIRFYYLLILLFVSSSSFAIDTIVYPNRSGIERETDMIELLKEALEKSKDKYDDYSFQLTTRKMNERRIMKEVMKGPIHSSITIFARSTIPASDKVHKYVQPVLVAPRMNILGYRYMLVNKNNLEKFSNIKSLDELRKYDILQGPGWLDIAVLRSNGLKVVEGSSYEGLFKMIDIGRVDMFSRGIMEAINEYDIYSKDNKNLEILKSFILQYDWPYMYWVHKENDQLKARIEYGFSKMAKDGSWKRIFLKHHGQAIKEIKGKTIIKLENDSLSPLAKEAIKNSPSIDKL